jgi:hypothetical protein
MNESIIIGEQVHQQFTSRATLVALGVKLHKNNVLEPIRQNVKIEQKTVKYTPLDKLTDGLIAILAGAHGLVEINKRVRSDLALQAAFGRKGCAEQSVVQETLDACTILNVTQMQQAVEQIYRRQSQGYRHDYQQRMQLLDIDTTGRPCGRKATFATKGYFARRPNCRGRQEGYVSASLYEEIVVKRLYSGSTQLTTALQPLVEAAEHVLEMSLEKRQQTVLRIDSGGGSTDDVNWMLERGYLVHSKDFSGQRAERLAATVSEWIDDPRTPGRQVGWVTEETQLYCRPIRRVAVRCQKANGQWGIGVILSNLSPEQVLGFINFLPGLVQDARTIVLAYVYFYDLRGGGVETEIKEDKQGLGTTHRNKKRFEGQQMVCQLEVLAHNILVWLRLWLASSCPKVTKLGLLRLVRDVIHINGSIIFSQVSIIHQVILNKFDPLAADLLPGFAALLAQEQVPVSLGEI